jgi:uncharacterized damage-inducible protein DinB
LSLSAALLPEFDQEMKVARTCLERVPTDKMPWRPHDKSMNMGRLASHIADMLRWTKSIFEDDELDIAPPGGEPRKVHETFSSEELLKFFDESAAAARALIAGASDEQLITTWIFKYGGHDVLTLPRIACIRSFVFNHIIHHRGQLSVYLRLNDIPVPSIYGPSADEGSM